MSSRIFSPQALQEEHEEKNFPEKNSPTNRPRSFHDFVGQKPLRHNLDIFIQAAKKRGDPLDHTLFSGPPGLGKTTLAWLIATEMGTQFRCISGPALQRPGDVAALLTNLQPCDILFIDEIHRLPIAVEEVLYSAMEDYKIDLVVGEGPHAHTLHLPVHPFTLVGATTRCGLLSAPLRDRFGITFTMEFYTPDELVLILQKYAHRLLMDLPEDAAQVLAARCRGTPRIALRILRRIRDFASSHENGFTVENVHNALKHLGISPHGLDPLDQKYLFLLYDTFHGGPVGVDTLAAALSETSNTIEDVIEPYLLQQGFLQRTARGRILTSKGTALGASLFPPDVAL